MEHVYEGDMELERRMGPHFTKWFAEYEPPGGGWTGAAADAGRSAFRAAWLEQERAFQRLREAYEAAQNASPISAECLAPCPGRCHVCTKRGPHPSHVFACTGDPGRA